MGACCNVNSLQILPTKKSRAELPDKALAHALVGGLTASLGGGNFLQGAAAAGLSEVASNELAGQRVEASFLHPIVRHQDEFL